MQRISERIWRFPDQLFYGEIVNTWLFLDDDKGVIVDGPIATDENLRFVESLAKPVVIFLTHSPCLGDAEEFRTKLGAEIVIHEAGRKEQVGFRFNRYVHDGERLSNHTVIIHTPGHKPEHACLYSPLEGGSMFTGDAVQADKFRNIIDPWEPGTDVDTKQNIQSLKKLLRYDFQRILPFHYYPLLTKASEKLRSLLYTRKEEIK